MKIIHIRRNEENLSYAKLSELTDISSSALCRIEKGSWLPGPREARSLEQALNIRALPDSSQILSWERAHRLASLNPFDWPRPSQIGWQAMERLYVKQLTRLGVPQPMLDWMKECLSSDSPVECLALCSATAAGAKGIFANPHALGYRAQSLLDRDGLALGERLLAGLSLPIGDKQEILLFPQVTVLTNRGCFRLDLLVLAGKQWIPVEVDGADHVLSRDAYRNRVLNIDPIRIPNEDVVSLQFIPRLLKHLKTRLERSVA